MFVRCISPIVKIFNNGSKCPLQNTKEIGTNTNSFDSSAEIITNAVTENELDRGEIIKVMSASEVYKIYKNIGSA